VTLIPDVQRGEDPNFIDNHAGCKIYKKHKHFPHFSLEVYPVTTTTIICWVKTGVFKVILDFLYKKIAVWRRVKSTSTVALRDVEGDKKGTWWLVTLSLGDINTGTWPTKLSVEK
jgi:hypothetical protein